MFCKVIDLQEPQGSQHTRRRLGSTLTLPPRVSFLNILTRNAQTYMKTTVNFSAFCDSFSETYKNNFTYEGKRALYDYLVEYEESTGEETELDPVAYCCEFNEYENLEDFQAEYGDQYKTIEDIEDKTTVIRIEGKESFIIANF